MADALEDGQQAVRLLELEDRLDQLLVLGDHHLVPGGEALIVLDVDARVVRQQRLCRLQVVQAQRQVEGSPTVVVHAVDAGLKKKKEKELQRMLEQQHQLTFGFALIAL
mgnify:CR=1 FL=1